MSTTVTLTYTHTYTGRGCHGPVLRAPPQIKMGGRLLRCRAKSDDFSRKLLPRFVLSDELYQPNQTISPSPTFSQFLNLPNEILSLIYELVRHAPSQVALALSCKHMAQIAKDINLSLSTCSPKYAGFLPREVFDVPSLMRSLTTWMPPHLRLCDHCLTMRPRSTTYWADVHGCETGNFWITKTGWDFADASWHKRVHDICPACHLSCSLSDHVDCDGCRVLGRLGDVDWARVSDSWRRRTREEIVAARMLGVEGRDVNHWDYTA